MSLPSVFLTFWQASALSGLSMLGIVKDVSHYEPSKDIFLNDLTDEVHDCRGHQHRHWGYTRNLRDDVSNLCLHRSLSNCYI
jgi:hypothetical protein